LAVRSPSVNPADATQSLMKFQLIDAILDCSPERIVAVKNVSLAEEYLQDHFPTFPILPGVFMLEVCVQAARAMLQEAYPAAAHPLVLGTARAVKYGAMVKPGESLIVEVDLKQANEDGSFDCRGTGRVVAQSTVHAEKLSYQANSERAGATAVSGRFTMRPARLG